MPQDLNAAIYGVSPDTNKSLHVTTEGIIGTYGAGAVGVSPAAMPTDLIVLTGSATKTIRIKRIIVSGVATTAGTMDVVLIKRTAVNTGGTATNPSIMQFDTFLDALPTAVVSQYSVNPTALGAGVVIANSKLNMGVAGAASNVVIDFASRNDKALILRGVAQGLAINLNGAAVPAGGTIGYSIQWEEDNS
jgi:hypothetical protein